MILFLRNDHNNDKCIMYFQLICQLVSCEHHTNKIFLNLFNYHFFRCTYMIHFYNVSIICIKDAGSYLNNR